MEYDEQVSARLDMSLDEIIGQERQDGTTQVKKRRGRGGPPGPPTPQPATINALPTKLPALPGVEPATRYPVPVPPPHGNPNCFPARPPPPGRSLPTLMRGPPGRPAGPPPFGMGPRPPFHVPSGHPRIDRSWPRPRHPVSGYLVPPNGMQPPPPPMGAGPAIRCGPPQPFPLPPLPGGAGEVGYPPRRPMIGPYGATHPMQAGPPRPGWKRSRYLDDGRDQNGEHSPRHPMGYPAGMPGLPAGPPPHVMGDSNGSLPNQMSYGYASRAPQSICGNRQAPEYYDPAYAQDSGVDQEHIMYGIPGGEALPHASQRGHAGVPDNAMNRQAPPDQCTSEIDFSRSAFPLTGPAPAVGSAAGAAPQGERREFTVIVSNVSMALEEVMHHGWYDIRIERLLLFMIHSLLFEGAAMRQVPKDLPAVEIQEAFSCMGTVLRTDIMLNSKGEHTGRVCIAYASAEAAKTAVAQFDGGDLNGNTIRVFAE